MMVYLRGTTKELQFNSYCPGNVGLAVGHGAGQHADPLLHRADQGPLCRGGGGEQLFSSARESDL